MCVVSHICRMIHTKMPMISMSLVSDHLMRSAMMPLCRIGVNLYRKENAMLTTKLWKEIIFLWKTERGRTSLFSRPLWCVCFGAKLFNPEKKERSKLPRCRRRRCRPSHTRCVFLALQKIAWNLWKIAQGILPLYTLCAVVVFFSKCSKLFPFKKSKKKKHSRESTLFCVCFSRAPTISSSWRWRGASFSVGSAENNIINTLVSSFFEAILSALRPGWRT